MEPLPEVTTKQLLRRVLKEPLVHFLLVGFILFVVFDSLSENAAEAPKRIVVDDDALVAFLQSRSRVFAPESFKARLDSLPAGELERLIDDFVRQEALYREAKALGLHEKDFGVRQRMISQLEFINQGVVSSAIELSDDDLEDYLERNEQRYFEPATITFTHVFLSSERHGDETAQKRAQATLKELNGAPSGNPVPFHVAPAHGDRFLFHQNYVNQDASEVKSHFGNEMQQQLFALQPDDKTWRGPFRSPYGYHLVLVTKQTDLYLPSFEELRRRLEMDAYRARLDEELRQIENSVIRGYSAEIDDALTERLEKEGLEAADEPE